MWTYLYTSIFCDLSVVQPPQPVVQPPPPLPSSPTSHIHWPSAPWWCHPKVGQWGTRSPACGQFLHRAAPSVWHHIWDGRGPRRLQADGVFQSHRHPAQFIVSPAPVWSFQQKVNPIRSSALSSEVPGSNCMYLRHCVITCIHGQLCCCSWYVAIFLWIGGWYFSELVVGISPKCVCMLSVCCGSLAPQLHSLWGRAAHRLALPAFKGSRSTR